MPYVGYADRQRFRPEAEAALTQGQLNYQITCLLVGYLTRNGLSYGSINDCLGAMDGASKEFYRRVAAPYEDQKLKQNGDVYREEHTRS